MKFSILIEVKDTKIYNALKPDEETAKRHKVIIKKKGGKTFVKLEAEDATALKAILNSFIRQIMIYEKVREEK